MSTFQARKCRNPLRPFKCPIISRNIPPPVPHPPQPHAIGQNPQLRIRRNHPHHTTFHQPAEIRPKTVAKMPRPKKMHNPSRALMGHHPRNCPQHHTLHLRHNTPMSTHLGNSRVTPVCSLCHALWDMTFQYTPTTYTTEHPVSTREHDKSQSPNHVSHFTRNGLNYMTHPNFHHPRPSRDTHATESRHSRDRVATLHNPMPHTTLAPTPARFIFSNYHQSRYPQNPPFTPQTPHTHNTPHTPRVTGTPQPDPPKPHTPRRRNHMHDTASHRKPRQPENTP